MRSYILAVALSMMLAAVYVFQNSSEITVSFLMFSRVFPQGVWEAVLFSCGAVLMWIFSIFASLELRSSFRAKLKERDDQIAKLEEEKKSILNAFGRMPSADITAAPIETHTEETDGTVD